MKWVVALVTLLASVGGLMLAWGLLVRGWWGLSTEMRLTVVFLMLLLHAIVLLLVYLAVVVWRIDSV